MKITSHFLALAILCTSSYAACAQTTPSTTTPAPATGGMSGPAPGTGPLAACHDDAVKYCPDKTGPDRRACMQANMDKLSDGCKAAIAAMMGGAPH